MFGRALSTRGWAGGRRRSRLPWRGAPAHLTSRQRWTGERARGPFFRRNGVLHIRGIVAGRRADAFATPPPALDRACSTSPPLARVPGRGPSGPAGCRRHACGSAVRSSGGWELTTIDAGGAGSVVTIESGEGDDTRLEGFTITGGDAGSKGGGGARLSGSSPRFSSCVFLSNYAAGGGGGGDAAGGRGRCHAWLRGAAAAVDGHRQGSAQDPNATEAGGAGGGRGRSTGAAAAPAAVRHRPWAPGDWITVDYVDGSAPYVGTVGSVGASGEVCVNFDHDSSAALKKPAQRICRASRERVEIIQELWAGEG